MPKNLFEHIARISPGFARVFSGRTRDIVINAMAARHKSSTQGKGKDVVAAALCHASRNF
jgi:hypothetical protein